MVLFSLSSERCDLSLTVVSAIRPRLSSNTLSIPASRLGDTHTRHSALARRSGGWKFPQRGHDTEQQEEGGQGGTKSKRSEGEVV